LERRPYNFAKEEQMTPLATIRGRLADLIAPELKHERRNLLREIAIDSLTGVANRYAFDLAKPTAESDDQTAFVLFDANNFGKLNKIAGHAFGDQALKEIAQAIKSAAAAYGYGERVFRLGGDEFVVICPIRYAAAIRDRAESAFGVRFPAAQVSISGCVGLSIEAADVCLQDRKRERKENNG
jgi:diguanylate cyclase (GGDEF)-like protein